MEIARRQTPEEQELERKRAELVALESKLIDRELELATLHAELATFERTYLGVVGKRYAQLDEIEAEIAEAEARSNPKDEGAKRKAAATRQRAQESAGASEGVEGRTPKNGFVPSEDLKKLYREVAKAVHPDLGATDEERARRHHFMADANQAYEACDERRLKAILQEWESCPESVKGDGIGTDLVRMLRKIAQTGARLEAINSEIAELKESDLFALKHKVEKVKAQGHDLLAEMAARLDGEIAKARKRLSQVTAR